MGGSLWQAAPWRSLGSELCEPMPRSSSCPGFLQMKNRRMLKRFGATDTEPTDPQATLWRFMDFTKYVSMLHRQALFFTRADQLPDPFEGYPARRRRQREPAAGSEQEPKLHERVFLSCWHRNDHESAAMWRLYLSYEDGVAIRSNAARLGEAFQATEESLLLGVVRYLDYQKQSIPAQHELDPFFCKRKSFEYETEVRLLWRAEAPSKESGRYITASLNDLIEEVVVSPTAEPWFQDLVQSVTQKYGLGVRIVQSGLFEEPI